MIERVVQIDSGGGLVGITTQPTEGGEQGLPTFVFLNAGLTHRVGPSRLHVRMARALADQGFPSLRFDWSGLGDSGARHDNMPVGESIISETREAMDFLTRTTGAQKFILIGICSGATVSFLTAQQDERAVGVALINAQSHLHGVSAELGEALRARTMTRHSYRIALRSSFRKKNWRKVLGGRISMGGVLQSMFLAPIRALLGVGKGASLPAFDPVAETRILTDRGVRVLHLYSEGDEGLDYFQEVLGGQGAERMAKTGAETEVILGANHVFTLLWTQDRLASEVCDWARSFAKPPAA
ncbi:MAG: alpha/beta fold hydrolase [Planctomycetota bacterium]|jgi:pimeloyl-ACP methyl ester carboxylesterase|nr:alpha/beta fold hydrolase [Planctomycetota bacterium]MDP6938407.1 alpha/beta fold hydrolase [Planctomycetota bacterium]